VPKAILTELLFISGRLTQPDGRSLYAYRCTDRVYGNIKKTVKENINSVLAGNEVVGFKALFCIFAAETWTRYYSGDRSYDFFFQVLDEPVPDQNLIRDWIRDGIKWWRLSLRQGNNHTRYFDTIACEGGLPLNLLKTDQNAGITRYLKEFLEQYYKHTDSLEFEPEKLAEEIALRQRLPNAWRDKSVYQSVIQLVDAIIKLQARVPNAIDPVLALDNLEPNWRRVLPISSVEDEVIVSLIKTLLGDIESLTKINKPLRWQRRLIELQGAWQILQSIELPREFSGERLLALSNTEILPVRLRLLLNCAGDQRTIGHLTRVQGSGSSAIYRCDKQYIELSGKEALEKINILLVDNENEYVIPTRGGNALGEMPWTFIDKDGEKLLFSEASTRTKSNIAWVVTPSDSQFTVNGQGECIDLGAIHSIDRQIYQVKGNVVFNLPELDSCDICCSAEEDIEQSFNLVGKTLETALNKRQIFLGLPKLQLINHDGGISYISSGFLEWRSLNDNLGNWSSQWERCFGVVWLRYKNDKGALIYRQKVNILPATTQVAVLNVGNNNQSGVILFSDLKSGILSVVPSEEYQSVVFYDAKEDTFRVTIDSVNAVVASQVTFNINWADGRLIQLELPVPLEGAAFVVGEELAPTRVAVGRLGAVCAIAQGNAFNYRLECLFRVRTTNYSYLSLLPIKFISNNDGRSQFSLHLIQESLIARMSMTNELDSVAILRIHKNGQPIASLNVARFDISFERDEVERYVFITVDRIERLGVNWEDRLQIKMLPLWNPKAQPIVLDMVVKDGCFAWQIPDILEEGPWWILGYDGNWARFRPSLWYENSKSIHIEDNDYETEEYRFGPTTLTDAIREPNIPIRNLAIDEIIRSMGAEIEHSDWNIIYDFIDLSNDYPASAVDVLRILIRHPSTLCLVLLKSNEESFDTVWRLAYQLPFSWHLIPINTWLNSCILYFSYLTEEAIKYNLDGDFSFNSFIDFRRRVIGRGHRFLGLILSLLQLQLFSKVPTPSMFDEQYSDLNLCAIQPEIFAEKLIDAQYKLQERHHADEVWPTGPETMDRVSELNDVRQFNMQNFRRPVLCAPFVAAKLALTNVSYSNELLFELGNIRDFDREWFDRAYYIELCIGLAKRLSTN
jgi:hypothetical protein